MTRVDVLIPVLGRPKRVRPLVASLAAASRFVECVPFFLCSPGDDAQILAVQRAHDEIVAKGGPIGISYSVMDWPAGPGDYAKKINFGWAHMQNDTYLGGEEQPEFAFLAADDLIFHPGWIERALACHLETHACVVGTNDGGNSHVIAGNHSTHSLVHRDYAGCGTIDEPDSGKLLHEGYDHNFCDTEFVETAIARETFAPASDSLVEHTHPIWGKAESDATYEKGQVHFHRDRKLHQKRQRLWRHR